MKYSDDYHAKYRIWASQPAVVPLPRMTHVPRFRSRKFNSYAEMNVWKRDLIREIARRGGVQWTN